MTARNLVALAALLLVVAASGADDKKKEDATTRSVQGVVTAADDSPLIGAVVQLKDSKTQQIRSFITQDQGTYYFHGLSKDVDYRLQAQYQGATSPAKTLSAFDTRKKAIINLKLNSK
jgi:hypothetical protein